jgi:hypothetical protein
VSDERPDNDIKNLWLNQPLEESMPISFEQLRNRAKKMDLHIRRRNCLEYVAAAFVVLASARYIYEYDTPLMQLGSALTIVAVLYIVWQLHKRGSARTLPQGESPLPWLESHKRQLERQRDALAGVWKWYIAPFVPGLSVFMAGRALENPPGEWASVPVTIAGMVFLATGCAWLNHRKSRQLQLELDELESSS